MEKITLHLSFFWHMHQPDYRGSDGVMKMPWVFLHAIKDYYEMPWLMSLHPGLKATFNLSASLIEQMLLYREPLKHDAFLSLWVKHPAELSDTEREWIVKLCTSTQYETMVRPIERYSGLYYQETFSDEELLDLEVVFFLAWCGHYLRTQNDFVKALFLKQQGYTQADKKELLDTLSGFVREILPFYADLQRKGIISVSTTPYFHPILPLLIDMENGSRANAATQLPASAYSLMDDAREHVVRSIALYESVFQRKPSGFWPAEGAVDEKSIALYKEYGIQWIATDEAILHRTLQNNSASSHFKPYKYDDVAIAFRDHGLSDLIGFEYRHMEGLRAGEHFMEALHQIALREKNPYISVIVDGENAWEFYPNNGLDFFNGLYGALSATQWCKTVTMDEVSQESKITVLDHITPGSWIHGTFDTWVGHPEKNRAWELIFETRRAVEEYGLNNKVTEEIRYHLLASECSDWFWWYGEDHFTEFSLEFDALFREHLIQIYRLMGREIPSHLWDSIISNAAAKPTTRKPHNLISPVIGNPNSPFFAWVGSGVIDERGGFSTMDRVRGPIDIIYYGYDDTSFYVSLVGMIIGTREMHVAVIIQETQQRIILDPKAVRNRLEFALSREFFSSNRTLHLRFELLQEDTVIQTMPANGFLLLELDDHFTNDWFI
ncbi:MAG: glycoside hydrolase family 57 protein [Sulfuricurvum sp.]|uniref:glycoside hydrolase family 57 protein n=1 Tax=Sulfuricurvum sp. TaxID=2025608 RepID=UPI0026345F08|nr:glycoside hydrolase family 57 protein [Sulfuricurvum sp.]MDD2368479.1 glycoside hydrolase family 57 protein [Sulfuricurvum sp.]MDD5117664.1 glycoside hydrolase family 57 protein [Sulfuricurvum sp.]